MIKTKILYLLLAVLIIQSCKKQPEEKPEDKNNTINSGMGVTPFSVKNTATLDSVINKILKNNKIPGLVVGVRSHTLGTYKNAFGFANKRSHTKMRSDAVFGIGSVHKNFKWILLHLLSEEGKLSLDDLVNKYIDEPTLPNVTIKHLMLHSTGLPDIVDCKEFMADAQANKTRLFPYDSMMRYLKTSNGTNSFGAFKNGRLNKFIIGTDVSYSSFGPLIAGEVVKKITGKNIRELIKEKIFKPLQLTSTSFMGFDPDPILLTPGYANYTTINPFFNKADLTLSFSSANGGAIHSNITDLLTYTHNQFTNPKFIKPTTISNMFNETLQGIGIKTGLGIIQFNDWKKNDFWGHAGYGIRSHSSTIFYNSKHKTSIVVLTNIHTPLDNFKTNLAISNAIIEALF